MHKSELIEKNSINNQCNDFKVKTPTIMFTHFVSLTLSGNENENNCHGKKQLR